VLVLELLQLEDVLVEEVLQLLVGEVDAKLLEAVELRRAGAGISAASAARAAPTSKFSKPKMSSTPMNRSDLGWQMAVLTVRMMWLNNWP
jgi:hypothetical protein